MAFRTPFVCALSLVLALSGSVAAFTIPRPLVFLPSTPQPGAICASFSLSPNQQCVAGRTLGAGDVPTLFSVVLFELLVGILVLGAFARAWNLWMRMRGTRLGSERVGSSKPGRGLGPPTLVIEEKAGRSRRECETNASALRSSALPEGGWASGLGTHP
ncbi:hypothetical protein MKEN_01000900 [Mycena kentingensis (nom. inval.)]|nr:hypothetical protein MKEN_01000900 [Mycena kentingensis (nom. inval.)]